MQTGYVRTWLFLAICICSNTSLYSQTIIYVDSSATGLNNGKSWPNAYKNLDSALINAIDPNEDYTIWMAKGTYTPSVIPEKLSTGNVRDVSFYITFSGTIVGGYSPGGSTLNSKLYPTILSGDIGIKNDSLDNAYHVLTLNYSDIEMSGITITGGNANGTGSLQVDGDNIPRYNGGGFYVLNGYADLHEIIAEHNTANYGGAIYNDSSDVDITNAVFDYNSSNRGGASYNNSASTYTMNNIVAYRNFAEDAGGAIVNANATQYNINNCTFVENFANHYLGGAIYNTQNGTTSSVTNCLFSGNYIVTPSNATQLGADIQDSSNAVTASYCVFQGQYHPSGQNIYVTNGSDLVNVNNPKGPDNTWMTKDDGLSITVTSLAFKNGGNGTIDSDITGALRDLNNGFDIGAYEINKCGDLTGRIIYVDGSATGAQNGISWANAFTSLQTAINIARFGCADTIKVAAGTYNPSNYILGDPGDGTNAFTFQIPSNIAILGGFTNGGSSIANPATNKTILSNKNNQVVFVGNVTNVFLSGLYIEDGTVQTSGVFTVNEVNYPSTDGGGIMVYNSGIKLRDCYINNNYASGNGGGMVAVNSAVTMVRCSFAGNRAGTEGGGIYIDKPSAATIIDSSVFTKNVTNYYYGGGISIEDNSAALTISNSHFTGNQTLTAVGNVGGGGAIYSNSGTQINIIRCVFDSNSAFYGGALYFGNSSQSLVGNSFFLNNSASASGGAVDCRGLGATFYNTVSSGNKAANNGGAFYSESPCNVYFSTFVRNSAGVEGGAVDGSVNLLNTLTWLNSVAGDSLTSPVNPMFANINNIAGPDGIYGTADDGLTLTLQSPFVNDADAPYDTTLISTDITGAPRVRLQSVEPDMGAYELDFCAASDFVNNTIYVDSSAVAGNNTGRDWANAFTDLETAFKAFRSGCNLDTIKVAKGTYFPTAVPGSLPSQGGNGVDYTFYLEENLALLGGYPTGGGVRDFHKNPTNLSGSSYLEHVVLINNKTNVSLDGFNIIDGFANDDGSGHTLVDNEDISTFGGGLYANNSTLNIKNIVFSNNSGSASYINDCTGSLTYCIWDSNQSDFAGGGVFNSSSSVEYDNCIFYKNIGTSAAWGGGVFINNTNTAVPSFEGCTFYGNSSDWGGGIFSGGPTPVITNCLFWGNSSINNRPDASANDVYAGILGGKQISFSLFQYTPTASSPGSNCIYGLYPDLADTANGKGPDNIWGTSDDGLKQTGSSFAINNGTNDSIPAGITTDITGAPRINTGVVDIGAYEYDCGFTNLTNLLVPVGTSEIASNTFSTCGTWQYRTSTTDPSKYIIEVDPNGNDNFNPIQITVDATNTQSQIATDGTGDTTAVALRMVSINAPGAYPVNGGLKIRIYYDPLELDTLPGIIHYWYKHTAHDKSTVLSDLSADTLLNEVPIIPSSYGIINGINYVEFDSLSSFSTFGYLGATHTNGSLPLNYLSFTAKWQQANNSVLLNWATANEVNVQSFIVERSQDAVSWQSIGMLNSDPSLALQHQYKWVDPQPLTGNSYYRIKELDKDGMSTFSATQTVRIGNQTAIFQILPNPVRNSAIIRLADITPVVNYKVTDVSGRVICNGLLYNMSAFTISLAYQSDGIYFVTVNGVTQKLVLSK